MVPFKLPYSSDDGIRIEIREYLNRTGASPYGKWFNALDRVAAYKVTDALVKVALGKMGNVKLPGSSLSEVKIDFGPGYRVYFGRDGSTLILLLGGGTKKRQDEDIAAARERWRDYLVRKRGDSCH